MNNWIEYKDKFLKGLQLWKLDNVCSVVSKVVCLSDISPNLVIFSQLNASIFLNKKKLSSQAEFLWNSHQEADL